MDKIKVYFIGIGGIGISALARWFLAQGSEVSGSDAVISENISDLRNQGIRVFIGHQSKNLSKKTNLVVFSAAVPLFNPEIQKAKKLGIPVKSYAEALGDLTKQYKTIAVAGAHGKSTTTALLSLVLIKENFDPTIIIGTKLKEFNDRNFRNGKSDWLVIEADEHHKSFLNYSPFAAIITNIDREHLDYYKNLTEIKNTFLKFIKNIQTGGVLVVNEDNKNLFGFKNKIEKIAKEKNFELYWYSVLKQRLQTQCNKIKKILKVPGKHNLSNALAVYILAKTLKIKDKDIFNALGSYYGAWRRMEYKGKLKMKNSKLKINIYDDYAHHPTEIKATLSAFRQKYPKSRLICVFQPHQEKRLKVLFKEFTLAFNDADELILLDIFKVKGRDELSLDINSEKLAEAVNQKLLKNKNHYLKQVVHIPYSKKISQILEKVIKNICMNPRVNLRKSATIIMMGAGDIYKHTPLLLLSDSKRKF